MRKKHYCGGLAMEKDTRPSLFSSFNGIIKFA